MAYKPSDRRQTNYAGADLDIRPIMNLMVCLIPILLIGAEFVKNTQLEVKLPPTKGPSSGKDKKDNKEKDKKLQFTVAITKDGYHLYALNSKVIAKKDKGKQAPPALAISINGEYDYIGLRNKAKELREEIKGLSFIDEYQVIITAEKDIPYEIFVKTQDALSSEKIGEEYKDIFPVVTIGVAVAG